MWRRGAIGLLLGAAAPMAAQQADLPELERNVRSIIAEYAGDVGVAIEHVESGRGFDINGHKRYPLASVYKLPMLVELFRQAEQGTLSLDDRIRITRENYQPWGPVMSRFDLGLEPTLRDLAYWMVVQTDNLATDLILERVGPANVRATLRRMGLDEISVDRSTKVLIFDYYGFGSESNYRLTGDTLLVLNRVFGRIHAQRDSIAKNRGPISDPVKQYSADPRDTGSPLQVNQLLVRLVRGEVVSKAASDRMIAIMLDTQTGPGKIPGLLPRGTPVAHKTGDWPTSNNDAGIIFLPGNRGHLAVTVLDVDMRDQMDATTRMIARIARAAYDAHLR
jgi:beta-lactamase class A